MKGKKKARVVGVFLILFVLWVLTIWLSPLPSPLFNDPYTTTLRSKDGVLLSASIGGDEQWRFPAGDSVPVKFSIAIKLYEDEYFQYHPGLNPFSIARAASQNIQAGKVVSGGSTISMQTVRMSFGNKPRSYLQKFIEILATFKLELTHTKTSILKLYAAHAPFGGNIVGLRAASWRYFGRSPHELSWAETATLSVLPNDPSSIFPGRNQLELKAKRDFLLDKIYSRGLMTPDELFLAKEEALPTEVRALPNDAYHLLYRNIKEGMQGCDIISTVDYNLQKVATNTVWRYSQKMAGNYIYNAAALIIHIPTAEVRAYIGNSNNAGQHGQHVDIVNARRSPGSLLKPMLYTAAIDAALIAPKQLLPDIPIFYKGFAPKNFDKEYRGAVPANQALTSSLNVPFVHLLKDYGYERFHHLLKNMGFNSLDKPAGHYGLSLILGGGETTLWELTNAYSGMARALSKFTQRPLNQGYSNVDYQVSRYLKNSENSEAFQLQKEGIFKAPSINFTFQALRAVQRPDQEQGWQSFASSNEIAWKTGTSYGFRDGWAIGLNGEYAVGVWVGNADGEGRPGLTGITAAAPLMFDLFELVESPERQNQLFGNTVEICSESGMPAGKICPKTFKMDLPQYLENLSSCLFHKTIHLDQQAKFQVNSSCYKVSEMRTMPWFVLPPVQSWYYKKNHASYRKLPPFDPNCEQGNASAQLALIYPANHASVHIPIGQDGKPGKVIFEAAHENKDAILYWHLDDKYLGLTQGSHQMGINTDKGKHLLTLVDNSGVEVNQYIDIVN